MLGLDLKRCGVRMEDERCSSFLSDQKKVFSVITEPCKNEQKLCFVAVDITKYGQSLAI